jgi:hypothetical protein
VIGTDLVNEPLDHRALRIFYTYLAYSLGFEAAIRRELIELRADNLISSE